jgi:hypothetical protein
MTWLNMDLAEALPVPGVTAEEARPRHAAAVAPGICGPLAAVGPAGTAVALRGAPPGATLDATSVVLPAGRVLPVDVAPRAGVALPLGEVPAI